MISLARVQQRLRADTDPDAFRRVFGSTKTPDPITKPVTTMTDNPWTNRARKIRAETLAEWRRLGGSSAATKLMAAQRGVKPGQVRRLIAIAIEDEQGRQGGTRGAEG